MLRTKVLPHDAPKWVFKEVDKIRKRRNREILSMKEEMNQFMQEEFIPEKKVRPWIPLGKLRGRLLTKLRRSRRPAWIIKVEEFLRDWLYD